MRTRSLKLLASVAITLLVASNMQAKAAPGVETSLSGNYLAGRIAAAARDNDAAAQFFADALKQDPGNPSLVDRLFLLQVSSGHLDDAERSADSILATNSQHRLARIVLALKALREGQYEKSREHLTESAYTPVGELTASLLSAWTFAAEGSLNAAIKELDKLDGNDSFANFKTFHLALIADVLNSPVRAEAAYKKAYQDAGTSLRVTQAYGNFLQRTGKAKEAIEVYKNFLATSADNQLVLAALRSAEAGTVPAAFLPDAKAGAGEALFSLAAAMNDDQSIDVAQVYAQLALAFSVDKPVMLTLLGDIYAAQQNSAAAIDAYERVPTDSALRSNADMEIAINLQRLEKPEDAIVRLKGVIARDPKNFDVVLTMANLLRNNEKYAEAEKAYSDAIQLLTKPDRNNWSVFYYRGMTRERLKTWPAAEEDFRKALELSPDEPSVLNYLGYSLIDMNLKIDEAIAMVKKAVEARPNDGYIVDSLGWAYFRLGDFEEAVNQMERAVDLKAGDPIIAEHLGDAYWRVGRKLEAKFQWQHAKDNKPDAEDLKRIEDKLKNGLPDLPPPVKPAANDTTKSNNG